MTREEELWAAIIAALQGDDVDVPVPAWRREEFLVGILGAIKGVEGASVPEPVWREEQYLKAMFDELSSGGVSSYKLLASKEFTVNTSSTTPIDVGTVAAGAAAYDSSKIIYVRIRDKAGVRDGYFTGSDSWFPNPYQYKSQTIMLNICGRLAIGKGTVSAGSTVGIFPYSIASDGTVTIKAKYSSTYGTINGTYVVEVYALEWPDKVSPFVTAS